VTSRDVLEFFFDISKLLPRYVTHYFT